jgi:WD40 repeat protein
MFLGLNRKLRNLIRRRARVRVDDHTSYAAFISYSHRVDGKLAPALQASLRRFALPWFAWRGRNIFRDDTGLALTEELWPSIQNALDCSQQFILLASYHAANSDWVRREVQHWLSLDRSLPLLVVTADDVPTWRAHEVKDNDVSEGNFDPDRSAVLPPALVRAYQKEPLWIDFRWANTEKHLHERDPRYRQAIARLVAAVEGKTLDQILDLDVAHKRRLITITGMVILLLAALSIWATANLVSARQQLANTHITQGRLLAGTRPAVARLHFTRAVQISSPFWLRLFLKKENGIARTWLGTNDWEPVPAIFWHGQEVIDTAYCDVRGLLATASADGAVRLWSTHDYGRSPVVISRPGKPRLWSLAFSGDGETIFVISNKEGNLGFEAWNTETGRPTHSTVPQESRFRSITWSPDHRFLLTEDPNGMVQVHSLPVDGVMGRPFGPIDADSEPVLSPSGRTVLITDRSFQVHCFDVVQGKQLQARIEHTSTPAALQFNPDGKTFTTVEDGRTLRFWTTRNCKPFGKSLQHDNLIMAVSISHDGKFLLTEGPEAEDAAKSGSVDVVQGWDLSSGRQLFAPIRYGALYETPSFSPDDKVFVTVTGSHARLWKASTGAPLGAEIEQGEQILHTAYSPNSRLLATAGAHGSIRVWALHDGTSSAPAMEQEGQVLSLQFLSEDTLMAVSLDHTVRIWTLPGQQDQNVRVFAANQAAIPSTSHSGAVVWVGFSPDDRLAVSASIDGTARIWDVSSGNLIHILAHAGRVNHASFSSDSLLVLTVSDDNSAAVWDASTGQMKHLLKHPKSVRYGEFSPDGTSLLTACADGHVRIWNRQSGKALAEFGVEDDSLDHASYGHDGKTVVSSSENGAVRVWSVRSGKEQMCICVDDHLQTFMALLSPDDRFVGIARAEFGQIWNLAKNREAFRFLNRNGVKSIAFNPDGSRMITGGINGTAQVWDVLTGRPVGLPLVNDNSIWQVVFSGDGYRVATAGFDHNAKVWDADSGLMLGLPFIHAAEVFSVAFSKDGTRLLTGSADKNVRIWKTEPAREDARLLQLKAEVASALTLDEASQTVRLLSESEWKSRRQLLNNLGTLKWNFRVNRAEVRVAVLHGRSWLERVPG